MSKTTERRRKAVELAPNPTAAWLLSEIMFVCQRDKLVEWNGDRFFARTTEEWATRTGLTARQVTRSLASLREAGLIETEQHIFGGKTVNHVRPTLPEQGEPGETLRGQPGVTGCGELPILDEDEDVDDTQTSGEEAGMDRRRKPTSSKKAMASDVASILKSNNAKAEENFSAEALDDAMAVAIEAPTQPRLGKVFMIAWVLAGYACRPGLSLKEMRQLSNILDACDDTKVGVFLIAEMVEHWASLATYLKENYQKSAPPDRPNIGYALAARVSVVQWLSDRVGVDHAQTFASDEDEEKWVI